MTFVSIIIAMLIFLVPIGLLGLLLHLLLKGQKKGKKISKKDRKNSKKKDLTLLGLSGKIILTIFSAMVFFGLLSTFYQYEENSCNFPNMNIGEECCLPNTDFGVPLCQSEAYKLNLQLKHAIENDILTIEREEIIKDKFSIIIPENYYLMRNAKIGELDIPLFLIAFGEEEEFLGFRIMHSKSENYEGSIEEFYEDFEEGLATSILNFEHGEYSEPEFFRNDKEGFDVILFDASIDDGFFKTYSSNAIVKLDDEILMVSYLSTDPYYFDEYYFEFENMIQSLNII